jgi:sialic acid synthase SpsE
MSVCGATVIEKHFTLTRADGGVDSTFSLEPAEVAQLVLETERAWQALGEVRYGAQKADRRVTRDAPKGTAIRWNLLE